jgi:hypothetical protein
VDEWVIVVYRNAKSAYKNLAKHVGLVQSKLHHHFIEN